MKFVTARRFSHALAALALLVAAAPGTSCGGSETSSAHCTPGASVGCVGPGGCTGLPGVQGRREQPRTLPVRKRSLFRGRLVVVFLFELGDRGRKLQLGNELRFDVELGGSEQLRLRVRGGVHVGGELLVGVGNVLGLRGRRLQWRLDHDQREGLRSCRSGAAAQRLGLRPAGPVDVADDHDRHQVLQHVPVDRPVLCGDADRLRGLLLPERTARHFDLVRGRPGRKVAARRERERRPPVRLQRARRRGAAPPPKQVGGRHPADGRRDGRRRRPRVLLARRRARFGRVRGAPVEADVSTSTKERQRAGADYWHRAETAPAPVAPSGRANRLSSGTTSRCSHARAARTRTHQKPAASLLAMHDWLNEGGKALATHYHYYWFRERSGGLSVCRNVARIVRWIRLRLLRDRHELRRRHGLRQLAHEQRRRCGDRYVNLLEWSSDQRLRPGIWNRSLGLRQHPCDEHYGQRTHERREDVQLRYAGGGRFDWRRGRDHLLRQGSLHRPAHQRLALGLGSGTVRNDAHGAAESARVSVLRSRSVRFRGLGSSATSSVAVEPPELIA